MCSFTCPIGGSKFSQGPGQGKHIVFVTGDAKQDWWRISEGQHLGPRPELVEEIGAVGGKPFWIYSVIGFIHVGSERLGWELPSEMTEGPKEILGGAAATMVTT